MKEALTKVKMAGMRKRAVETDKNKTYQRTDRVTVLGLVCEKMSERVALVRQEEEDRRVRQEVVSITQDESVDMLDDEGYSSRLIYVVFHTPSSFLSPSSYPTSSYSFPSLISSTLCLSAT